jgi:hypothetical protein
MPLTALLIAAAATTFVPPNQPVVDHSQPYHSAQPTVRRFEDRRVDDRRRANYNSYINEIDLLWQEYRAAGSTPQAFRLYQDEAAQAKTRYIYADPWYVPIHNDYYYNYDRYGNNR